MFVPTFQTTGHHHIPKDRSLNTDRRKNCKSHIKWRVYLNYYFAESDSPAGSARAFFFLFLMARFF
jgi:hypothetical protein